MEDNKHTIINGHTVALVPQALAPELATYTAAYSTPPGSVNGILLKDDYDLALRLRQYWINNCPLADDLSNVVVLVRDPIHRFISYISQYKLDPGSTISAIENLSYAQHRGMYLLREYLGDNNILFKYDAHLTQFLNYLGINSLPMPNVITPPLVSLTPDQMSRVQEIFADDIALYNSISSPGKLYAKTQMPYDEDVAPAFTLTKLAVRRKLRELGLEVKLDEFLNLNPQSKADWIDATLLSSDDPIMIGGISAFAVASGLSEAEVIDILRSAV